MLTVDNIPPAEDKGVKATESAVALAQLVSVLGSVASDGGETQAQRRQALRVQALLETAQVDATSRLAALVFACPLLTQATKTEQIEKKYGAEVAGIVSGLTRLQALGQRMARTSAAGSKPDSAMRQANETSSQELLRRMLLVIAADIRVVIVHLSMRMDLLRQFAAGEAPVNPALCEEARELLVPLANRLGLGFLKWELEDLAFRLLEPDAYKQIARALDEKRLAREAFVLSSVGRLNNALLERGLKAEVYGRPKHLASIAHKLDLKRLNLSQIHDLRALRVVVDTVEQCYVALDVVRGLWSSRDEEFDDYIARPKPNGYQSIHCVVEAEDGRTLEVQIRTRDMHRFAEFGVASHWRYKESGGTPPAKGSSASSQASHEAQLRWMRQLLAWQQDVSRALSADEPAPTAPSGTSERQPEMPVHAHERVYVLSPEARVIELPTGATPVDFAYHLHSELGHRCRGAKVNGVLVPLTRKLKNADTVEILPAPKNQFDAGPSRDWLGSSPEYLVSARAKAKVRQWFAAQQAENALARPAAAPEIKPKLPAERAPLETLPPEATPRRGETPSGGILVVGVDALMTRLARCCRPLPPDDITGYVSLGKGVTVHRSQCPSLQRLADNKAERMIATSWGNWERYRHERLYPVDIELTAHDRPALLRDVSEVFAKGKWNVLAVKTLSRKELASMRFTVQVPSVPSLREVLAQLAQVPGVDSVRRSADLGRNALHTDS